jgi:hypothetical protein
LLEFEEFFYPFLDEGVSAGIADAGHTRDQCGEIAYHDTSREESTVRDEA